MPITTTVDATHSFVEVFVDFATPTDGFPHFAVVERVYSDRSSVRVRGADEGELNGAQLLVWDTEMPLDAPVSYRAWAVDAPELVLASGAVTVPGGGGVWLKDPLRPWASLRLDLGLFAPACSTTGADLVFTGLGDEASAADATLTDVLNDPFPSDTYARRKGPTTSLSFASRTLAAAGAVADLFAAGGVQLLQAPAVYGWIDHYVQPGDLAMARPGTDNRKPWRTWTVPLTLQHRPAAANPAQGVAGATWCDIAAEFDTSAALAGTGATWLDVASGDVALPETGYGSGLYGDGPYGG